MNDQKIIDYMITFIEEKEKEILNQKYLLKPQKMVIVKGIIAELEKVISDEN